MYACCMRELNITIDKTLQIDDNLALISNRVLGLNTSSPILLVTRNKETLIGYYSRTQRKRGYSNLDVY